MKNIVEALIIVSCAWTADISMAQAVTLGCPYTGCADPGWHMPMSPPGQLGGGATPAPGPVAGTGIGYLIIYAGYRAVRRWRIK